MINPLNPPPIKSQINNEKRIASEVWAAWFRSIFEIIGFNNNHRKTWTPTFTGMTVVGSIAYTGSYYRFNNLIVFEIVITSSGGGTSASTAGTTYCNNLPYTSLAYGNLNASNVTTKISIGSGLIDLATKNGYTPTWGATANKIAISGFYQIDI